MISIFKINTATDNWLQDAISWSSQHSKDSLERVNHGEGRMVGKEGIF